MGLSNTAVPIEYGKFRDAVIRGEIPVNWEVSQQMNLIDHLIESPDFYYDDQAILGFIDFAEGEMTLTDGSDLTLLPTFKLWAEDLLAWYYFTEEKVYNPKLRRYEYKTHKRRLRNKQVLIVGRGAAKSVYAALIQAYFLTIDPDTTHQVVVAPTMDLAEETMSPIRTAITRARGPLFKFLTEGSILANNYSKTKLASTKKGIQNFMTNSLIEVRPMRIDKLQGLRSKVNTIDEWLSGKTKEDVITAVEQGASKNQDYIIVATSSEGTVRNGPGDTVKMELLSILRGDFFVPSTSIWYYRLDDIKEIKDPEMWIKANPNLGGSVSYDSYQKDVDKAERDPSSRNEIIAKRFGIPVEGYTYFFRYEETLPHPKKSFDNLPCCLGGDLSQGDDFCAFTFLFPLGDGRFGIDVRSYITKRKHVALPQAMQLKYDDFINEGSLIIMDDIILDMMKVYDDLDAYILDRQYTVVGFGYDPYNAIDFINRWKVENGDYGLLKVRQGVITESVPLGELKILAQDRRLLFHQDLMKFAMGNAVVIEDNNGNRKLSKLRSEEKIDNVAALVDAWVSFRENQEAFM